jgi:hypothetical protein
MTLSGLHFCFIIPLLIPFIVSDAASNASQIAMADCDSCPDFNKWQRLRASGIVVDFRRIRRIGSGLGLFSIYVFDLSRFNEESVLNESGSISTKLDRRCDVGSRIVVKSICLFKSIESR